MGVRAVYKAGQSLRPITFTVIISSDIEGHIWIPADRTVASRDWAIYYTRELEKTG